VPSVVEDSDQEGDQSCLNQAQLSTLTAADCRIGRRSATRPDGRLKPGETDVTRYRLKDDGYPTFKWIYQGNQRRGHVTRNADGTFTGRIGTVLAHGQSEDDAFHQVWAEVDGLDVSELRREVLHPKKVQTDTEAVIDWLSRNAAEHGGRLSFTNISLANAIGKRKPDQALGNLVSRLDFACYLTGLPTLGCAADETFKGAWQRQENYNRSWDFPVGQMRRRAKTHHWTDADFDRIRYETQRLTSGSAPLAWREEFAKREARIKAWAET
jgi:hypothetical protein